MSKNSTDLKQKERQQRGDDFQNEMRRSWRLVPNCWRMRIADGLGATRPGDELILLEDLNILAEHKRTEGDSFKYSMLRAGQVKGLIDFDQVMSRNIGMVFVSFLNEAKGIDKAYGIRLITALKYMKLKERMHIKLEELEHKKVNCIYIPRLLDSKERTYDLRGVNECYRFL